MLDSLHLLPELRQKLTLGAIVLAIVLLYFGYAIIAILLPCATCWYVSVFYPKEWLWQHSEPTEQAMPQEHQRQKKATTACREPSRSRKDDRIGDKPKKKEGKLEASQPIVDRPSSADYRSERAKASSKPFPADSSSQSNHPSHTDFRSEGAKASAKPLAVDSSSEMGNPSPRDSRSEDAKASPKSCSMDSRSEGDEVGDQTLLLPPARNKDSCRECWKPGNLICRRCNRVKYCSRACQKSHWSVHKQFCGKGDHELRHIWSMMWPECSQNDGDVTRHRQFVHHVGGNFWCTENGWRVLHSLVSLSAVLRHNPSEKKNNNFRALLQDAYDLGADVNEKCRTGDTPLHMACKDGSKEADLIVDFLLESTSADLTIRNNDGKMPEETCRNEECRAKVAAKRELFEMRAAEERKRKEEERKARIQKSLRPPSRKDCCRQCWKPGSLICRRCNRVKYCSQECQRSNWAVHKQFCGKGGSDLNKLWNAICEKCVDKDGSLDDLRCFVQHVGGDFRVDPDSGWEVLHNLTILSAALLEKRTESTDADLAALVKDACDFGADVNAQSMQGATPLHMACTQEHGAGRLMVELLLKHDMIDVRIRDKAGRTARECCPDRDMWELFAAKATEAEQNTRRELSQKRAAAASLAANAEKCKSEQRASGGGSSSNRSGNRSPKPRSKTKRSASVTSLSSASSESSLGSLEARNPNFKVTEEGIWM